MIEATKHFVEWQKMVVIDNNITDWEIKNTGGGDGICLKNSHIIICTPNEYALFLHEVAHAITPKHGHDGYFADRFTGLCKRYLEPKN